MISQLWIWNVAGYADLLESALDMIVIHVKDVRLLLFMIHVNMLVFAQRLLYLAGRLWKAGNGVVILNAEIFCRKIMEVMMSEHQNMKTKSHIGASLLVAMLAAGCSIKSEVSQEDMNKHMSCKDTRDGEVFSFKGSAISNVSVGIGSDSCFDIIDDSGKKRTLCKSHELWLKCQESR